MRLTMVLPVLLILADASSAERAVDLIVVTAMPEEGLAWFSTGETLFPGEALRAEVRSGIVSIVILQSLDGYLEAAIIPPEACGEMEAGDSIRAEREEKPAPPADPDVEALLKDLRSFQEGLLLLSGESGEPELPLPRSLSRWDRFHGEIGVRVTYERYSRSEPMPLHLDPENEGGILLALDRLDRLIDRARELPNVRQADLDDAAQLASEARAILQDPQGDREEAVLKIQVAEILVQLAVMAAGVSDEDYTVSGHADRVTDRLGQSAYARVRREWSVLSDGRLALEALLEGGDRYTGGGLDTRLDWRLNPDLRMVLRNDFLLRTYPESGLDDFFQDRADLEAIYRLSPRLTWHTGIEGVYRGEYDTDSDDGFLELAPRTGLFYDLDPAGRIGLRYDHRGHRKNERDDALFDWRRDRVRLTYDYYGRRFYCNAETRYTWRDQNRPARRDDYEELTADATLHGFWSARVGTGIRLRYDRRRYETTGAFRERVGMFVGDDNTDYDQWEARPYVEFVWSRALRTTLELRHTRLRHRDRVREDGIDKSLGDSDENAVSLSWQYSPWSRCDLLARYEYGVRNYPNGETGRLDPWFANLRYTADARFQSFSLYATQRLFRDLELRLSGYFSMEDYPSYGRLNNEQLSAETALAWRF